MCLLMDEPDKDFVDFLAQSDAPVYKYKPRTTTQYDAGTGLVEVELGIDDVAIAVEVCLDRMLESEGLRLSGRAGCERGDGQIDLEGALAEVAFARGIGSPEKPATGTYKAPDIAGVQVRSTPLPTNRLIVRECDNADDVFVLLTGSGPLWTIRGGILGAAARKVGDWYAPNNRPGAWFVAHSFLTTLDKSRRFGHIFQPHETAISTSPIG